MFGFGKAPVTTTANPGVQSSKLFGGVKKQKHDANKQAPLVPMSTIQEGGESGDIG